MNLDVKLLVFNGGETSKLRGQKARKRTSQAAKEPGGESARGRTSQRANEPGGEPAKGRKSQTP